MKKLDTGGERSKFREGFPNISLVLGAGIVFSFGLYFFPTLLKKTEELPDFALPGWSAFVFNLPGVLWLVLAIVLVAGAVVEMVMHNNASQEAGVGKKRRWILAPLIGGLVLVLAVQASGFAALALSMM